MKKIKQPNNLRYNKEYQKNWYSSHPWVKYYSSAWNRCNEVYHRSYYRYGALGIKLLMKPNDFKYLWFRDKAYLMKAPSIDRINPNENYTLDNCRFIELSENVRRRYEQT